MSERKITLQLEITLPENAAPGMEEELLARLRSPSATKRLTAYSLMLSLATPWPALAELPVGCEGACGGKPTVEFGNVVIPNMQGGVPTGTKLDINQYSDKALLNWKTFNISEGSTVNFNQVSDSAVALNRIHDQAPSQILGNLNANGHVYLLNGAGVMFGENAQVNVGSLLATTLDLDDEIFKDSSIFARFEEINNGVTSDTSRAALFAGENSNPDAEIVNKGTIIAENGGNVLLVAPTVKNEGTIVAEDGGQVILAGAKDRLYIIPSDSSDLRGFLVEVGGDGGTVTNEAAAKIFAERGNATLLASQIHQKGEIKTSTDSGVAGSIFLLARDHADTIRVDAQRPIFTPGSSSAEEEGDLANSVTLYENSLTEIELELATAAKAIDAVEQKRSRIDIEGKKIDVQSGADILAKHGELNMVAAEKGVLRYVDAGTKKLTHQLQAASDTRPEHLEDYRVFIDSDAHIDVSGSDAQLSVQDHLVEVELFSNELKDSPVQKNGPLRGKSIVVDAREGTPLADISGALANQQRTLAERTTEGGDVRIWSDGDIVVKDDAVIDISGGVTDYTGGYLNTSKLIVDGRIVDVGEARPDIVYDGIRDSRRGISLARYEEGYSEGHDAGSVQLAAHGIALDGDIQADTYNGIHQKAMEDQAKGGTLNIGFKGEEYETRAGDQTKDFRAPNIQLVDQDSARVSPLSAEFGLNSALTEAQTDTLVLSNRLSNLGVQHYDLSSNGAIEIGERGSENQALAPIQLGAGASLSAEALQVTVNQGVTAHGGTIDLNAKFEGFIDNPHLDQYVEDRPLLSELLVKEGVSLDVSGVWSNDRKDYVTERRVDTDAIHIDGGSISLSGGALTLQDGVRLDVGGSAHLDEQGALLYGQGGELALSATDNLNGDLVLGAGVQFDGTAFKDGGSLSVTAPSLVFTDRFEDSLTSVKSGDAKGVVAVNSSTFREHGFASFEFTQGSNREVVLAGRNENGQYTENPETIHGDLLVKSDFDGSALQQSNWVFPLIQGSPQLAQVEDPTLAPGRLNPVEIESQAQLDSLVSRGQLSDHDRGAMQIALTLENNDAKVTDIRVEQGAELELDAHADSRFTLTSETGGSIDIDRDISVHGGEIAMKLDRDPGKQFNLESALRVREGSTLDVSGVFERDLSRPLFETGITLEGGSINLASSGFIVLEEGSLLDASGAVATVDALGQARPGESMLNGRVQQASNGGDIGLNSDEGNLLAGDLNLAGGTSERAGGTLSVATRLFSDSTNFPAPSRQDVVQMVGQVSVPEQLADVNVHGVSQIDLATLVQSGASNLSIQANQLQLQGGQSVVLPGALQLDVDKIHVAAGGTDDVAHLDAAYVRLGNLNDPERNVVTDSLQPATDAQKLRVDAELIDLSGRLAVENVSDLTLHSEGDVRLRQVANGVGSASSPAGLKMQGDLTIEADRVYAVSNTHYTIDVSGVEDNAGSVSLLGNGTAGSALPVLSANSELRINAENLHVDTEVAAPFGQIHLNAQAVSFDETGAATYGEKGALTLGEHARLRASADGEKIPYGFTLNGREWYYGLPGQTLLEAQKVVTAQQVNIPKAAVNLSGDSIDMQEGAVIDVSNSGDLVATEFVPGTGGSYDYLAQSDKRFAILPTKDAGYAPFDQRLSANFNHAMGTQIVLGAGSGVPAGTYTLLPAEYAQLEGAYIVNLEPKVNLQAGRNSALPDGTPLSSAYLVDGLSNQISSDYFAVSVRPGSDANKFSEYRRSEMKEFAPAALARLQQNITGSVFDAGSIGIDVVSDLNLSGQILGAGDADSAAARDARIDIAAAQLRIVNAPSGSDAEDNFVELRAEQVNQLAEGGSLLLGGKRTESVTDGRTVTAIEATAQEVVVAANTELQASSLLLSADDSITLENGARLLSLGGVQNGNAQNFQVNDGSALLAVSDQRIGAISRAENAPSTSSIRLAEGSHLDAASLVLDATDQLTLAGELNSRGGDVLIGADLLALGNTAASDATQISQSVLDSLSDAASLSLRSDDALRMGAGIDLAAQRLTLDSAGLNNQLAGGSASITADTLLIKGQAQTAGIPEDVDSTGTLMIQAEATEVQGGSFSVFGAQSVALDSGEALVFSKSSDINTSKLDFIGQADVNLATDRIALNTGSVAQLNSTGALTLAQSAATSTRTLPLMLGGNLSVNADQLHVDTRIDAHSGVIELDSLQDLTLGEHAVLDVSGQDVHIQDVVAHTRGGRVTLESGADLTLHDAARIDVSASGTKETAGTLELFSRAGTLDLGATLDATSGAQAQGGRLRIDTAIFGSSASLSDVLNQAHASGFDRQVDVRVREQAADIAQNVALTADKISISSDQTMTVAGTLGTGTARAGELSLTANEGLTLASTARLNMNSTEAGGEITLASRGEDGGITLVNGAQVALGAKDRLTLAANRTETGVDITGSAGSVLTSATSSVRVLGSDQVELAGTLGNADFTTALTAAQTWMTHETALAEALGLNVPGLRAEIAPELLFTSTQDLTVSATNLDLGATDFAGKSRHGHLGILSAGDLLLNTDISDGFGTGALMPSQRASFDLTLVAGVDLDSASLTDTAASDALLQVGTGVHVRTGDGDIDIASGGDIVLQAADSVIYTAGQDSGYALDNNNLAALGANQTTYKLRLSTPIAGGDLRIQAGGDIQGGTGVNDRSQLFTDWLVSQQDKPVEGSSRGGITGPELDSGMWINYANFKQGLAAMGGGDLSIEAGGDLTRISASVPTTIHYDNRNTVTITGDDGLPVQVNQATFEQRRFGEGQLNVEARGDIASANILVGDGTGSLFSEASLSIGRQVGMQRYDAASNFALMGGQLRAESLHDLNLSLLLDPGLMDYTTVPNNRLNGKGLFFTTESDSAFAFRSITGNLNYSPNSSLLGAMATSSLEPFGSAGMSIPAQFSMQALSGNLVLGMNPADNPQIFNPAENASVDWLAGQDIVSNIIFQQNRERLEDLPDVTAQLNSLADLLTKLPSQQQALFRSDADRESSRMVAGNDIRLGKSFMSAEAMHMSAGNSVRLSQPLKMFHHTLDSQTVITAQNNIALESLDAKVEVVGPGQLWVAAGGDITLGTSQGITSASGSDTPVYGAFPAADITLLAGATLEQFDGSALLSTLLENPVLETETVNRFIADVAEASESEDEPTRLAQAVLEYYKLPADQREAISASFASEQDFQRFVNQALLTDSLRSVLDKPEFYPALYQELIASDAGKASLLLAVQKESPLPVDNFEAAQILLDSEAYDLKTRLELVTTAFRTLPETTQLMLTHTLVSSATDAQRSVLGRSALFGELNASGVLANSLGLDGYDRGFNALDSVFDGIDYLGDLKSESSYRGDIDIFYSKVYSLEGGDINMFTPGGSVNGGVVQSPDGTNNKTASDLGVVVQQAGDVNVFVQDSYLVNQSRVFTLDNGSILIWASEGNIDAGKGAKTAVAIPPPVYRIINGIPVLQASSSIAGSGIRQFDSGSGRVEFDEKTVNLIAPNGEVNAGDAGIGAAGNINIAAARVVGADNIDVGGISVGVPVDAGGLNAGLSGLGSVASEATKNAAESATTDTENAAPLGEEALAWLEVFVLGYGDEEEEKNEQL